MTIYRIAIYENIFRRCDKDIEADSAEDARQHALHDAPPPGNDWTERQYDVERGIEAVDEIE